MAEHLEEYRAKRHAGKTPEPLKPKRKRKRGDPIFIVQRHSARRLHYDLRLERDGVLLSWALPRGVPLRGGERALAVHVEDHPLEYADFEGDIPARAVRRRLRRAVGPRHLRARARAPRRHAHRDSARRQAGGRMGARARQAGRRGAQLADRARLEGLGGGPQRGYEPMFPARPSGCRAGADWAFEIAWDGVRALAPMEGTRGALPARRRRRARRSAASSCSRACPAPCARATACSTA